MRPREALSHRASQSSSHREFFYSHTEFTESTEEPQVALPCGVLYIVYRLLVNVYWSLNTAPASLNFNRSSLNEAEGTINLSPLTCAQRFRLRQQLRAPWRFRATQLPSWRFTALRAAPPPQNSSICMWFEVFSSVSCGVSSVSSGAGLESQKRSS